MVFALACWTEQDRELVADVELALSRAGMDITQAAYAMALDPAQWTKQRQGIGHISANRLARLGPAFWREFMRLRLERMGFAVFHEGELSAALLQVVAMARKPMARMGARRKERVA